MGEKMNKVTNTVSLIAIAWTLSACGMSVPECYDDKSKKLLADAIFQTAEQGGAELLHSQGLRRMLSAAGENGITRNNTLEITKAEQLSVDENTKVRTCKAIVSFVPNADNQAAMKEINDGAQTANDNLIVGFTQVAILPDLKKMYAEKITSDQTAEVIKSASAFIINNVLLATFARGQKAPVMNLSNFTNLLSSIETSPHFTDEEKYLLMVDESNNVLNNTSNPRSYALLKEDIANATDAVRKIHLSTDSYTYTVAVKKLDGKEDAVVEPIAMSEAQLKSLVLTTLLGKAYLIGKEKIAAMQTYNSQKAAQRAAFEAKAKQEALSPAPVTSEEEKLPPQAATESSAGNN